jgi:hypothetical protein
MEMIILSNKSKRYITIETLSNNGNANLSNEGNYVSSYTEYGYTTTTGWDYYYQYAVYPFSEPNPYPSYPYYPNVTVYPYIFVENNDIDKIKISISDIDLEIPIKSIKESESGITINKNGKEINITYDPTNKMLNIKIK